MVRRNEVIGRGRIDVTIGLSQGFIKHHEDAAPSGINHAVVPVSQDSAEFTDICEVDSQFLTSRNLQGP